MYSELHHENYQRLHDAAKLQAQVLRQGAINAFWHHAHRMASRAFHALRHPAALQLPREA
ncbi:hypothetical protein [Polaromonas sp.]|uniref:hypothetical protein n=1 Tax=Polaromonas sp. TaxID=1869339 RepID=UPI003263619D